MGAVVLCFAESGSRVPTSGGAYGTVEAALGPMAGFLTGAYIWISSALACGGVAAALCDAVGVMIPALAAPAMRLGLLVVIFGPIVWLNVRGAASAARIIAWGTAIKLVPLVLFVAVGGLWLALGHEAPQAPVIPAESGSFAEAMILALFAFCGMETPLAASGEVRDPARTIPRATIQAMLLVLVLYLAIQYIAQGLLGPALGGSKEPLAAGARLIDPNLGLLLFAGGALSRLAWIGSDILGAPRVLFAFGRDGFLPAILGRTHPRFATPYVAILVHSAIAFAFAATGSFARLAIWSTLGTAGIYFLACWAALVLRRRGVAILGRPLSFRVLPVAAVVGMTSMVALVAIAKPEEIAGFVGVTLATLALYLVMKPRRAKQAA
jgi:amino acid transporter